MNLSPEDVAIGRVRLRAPRSEHHRAVDELQRANWPQSGHDEWVFIRQVKVRASRPWLGLRATEEARRLTRAAVRPGINAGTAEAVRFEDLAHVLASLSADLVAGRASACWYWQRWAHLFRLPAAEALRSLWDEHIAHFSSITKRLAEMEALPTAWQSLMPLQALQLLARLSHHARIPLPLPARAPPIGPAATEYSVLPKHLQARWRGALEALECVDPRRWLAASLVTLEWRPLLLRNEPELELTRISTALASAVRGSSPDQSRGTKAALPVAESRDRPAEQTIEHGADAPTKPILPSHAALPLVETAGTGSWVSTTEQTVGQPLEQRSDLQAPRRGVEAEGRQFEEVTPRSPTPEWMDSPEARISKLARPPSPDRQAIRQQLDSIDHSVTTDSAATTTMGDGVYTEQGGLFYLINFFNRPEVTDLLAPLGGMQILPDGWAWLYRLGMEWGLDPSGSLARWMADQMGFDEVDELATLPQLPAREDILALGGRLYGEQEIWSETLLATQALVRHSPSHVDVYYPLAEVRLSIRLAGLDINPGWVDWLGRVVTFYYQDSPLFSRRVDQ